MEVIIVILIIALFAAVILRSDRTGGSTPKKHVPTPPASGNDHVKPHQPYEARPTPQTAASTTTHPRIIEGRAYVIDGDSIKIKKQEIRLFGVDAPEFTHPYGVKAKWALASLCKGQTIKAEITSQDVHGRTVARCLLPDGRDLSAEMVKQGLAIDWPKFSGGRYRHLEPDGIRKKLWLADARQKGHMHVWKKYEAAQKARVAEK